jgi:hypothetical protein
MEKNKTEDGPSTYTYLPNTQSLVSKPPYLGFPHRSGGPSQR